MITFTRRWAKDVLTILKKAFGMPSASLPATLFRAGADGLTVQAQSRGISVQYHDPAPHEPCELLVPPRALVDVCGAKSEPASFYRRRDGVLGASWEERSLVRQLEYPEGARKDDPFPTTPERLAANPPRLRQALADACAATDATSSRYALGCLQLRGERGDLCATDGRHLLLQRGFAWGFDDTVLLPANKLFAAKELGDETDVLVGRVEKHAYFRVGPWSFWLPLELEARFPQVDSIVPAASGAQTTWDLAPADAEFLLANLHRLPGSAMEHKVTVDLNGSVAIRAQTEDSPQGTEMVLRNSGKTGEDVRIGIDRRYLARAATMRFDKIYLSGTTVALLAEDATRSYLWMPLDDSKLLGPSPDYVRIESPIHAASARQPPASRRLPAMPKTSPESAAPATVKAAARNNKAPATASLDQSLKLRDALREQLAAVKELIRTLQAERKSRRLLKATLDSLKDLHKAA